MSIRPTLSKSLARLSIRSLQTTAPLPPPTTPLPPAPSASSSASAFSSASSSASTSSSAAALARLPPLLPATTAIPSLPSSTSSAIDLISSQSTPSSSRYILARLHARTYLLHPRDILTIPLLKPVQSPGTTLSLTKILEVGSRDYAIRSPASDAKTLKNSLESWKERRMTTFDGIPGDLVRCELTVLEHTKSPMERILKKKRRKGYKKTIEHKQAWTRLRVGDIILGEEAASP
ncbi:hypothetical protein CI109_105646 [Kwoniella shandongensis]|uniref:Large ribosomal subunit protein bL21m n=1 Tax=Kwoniella shandongensis TaxID=1734106 RepID=A0A5M6C2T4_9TREE|nr:uncharacterized protein CI109_002362 [Kwoniella shandongensis]KAA5529467.1 hypothetical protein CI109_002362 [Kwoniella shandongensis]